MAAAGRGESPGAGDVGRRVAQRRRDLGLSRQELAQRARMAESYVEYVEEHAAHVPSITVSRLASALDTNVDALSGVVEVPPGQRGSAEEATLVALNERESRRLLAAGGIGRFVFTTRRGPVARAVSR